jgi:hypothetical protein
MVSSGLLHRVALVRTDVSEEAGNEGVAVINFILSINLLTAAQFVSSTVMYLL